MSAGHGGKESSIISMDAIVYMYVGYVTICKYYDDYLFVFETEILLNCLRLNKINERKINANILLILYVKNDSNRKS